MCPHQLLWPGRAGGGKSQGCSPYNSTWSGHESPVWPLFQFSNSHSPTPQSHTCSCPTTWTASLYTLAYTLSGVAVGKFQLKAHNHSSVCRACQIRTRIGGTLGLARALLHSLGTVLPSTSSPDAGKRLRTFNYFKSSAPSTTHSHKH